jgi:nucleotide-binding universal stress UspA family protein
MYARILVAIDGSTAANLALHEAVPLARSRESTIRLLHVVCRPPLDEGLHPLLSIADIVGKMETAGGHVLQSARALVRAGNVPVRVALRKPRRGGAANAIVREAARWNAELIVMGAHGLRGASSILMGTTAQGVLREARCPLLVLERSRRTSGRTPAAKGATYRRILVPVDGSRPALAGLREAARLAAGHADAIVRLVHVLEPHPAVLHGLKLSIADTWLRGRLARGEQILRDARAFAKRCGVRAEAVFRQRAPQGAAERIAKEAERWLPDVIVMGTHGRRGIGRAVLGSDAQAVLRTSAVPVIAIRA